MTTASIVAVLALLLPAWCGASIPPQPLPANPHTTTAPVKPKVASGVPVDNAHVTYDTVGAKVDAHDGKIVQDPVSGLYWLFGTSYGCGFAFTSPAVTPWCGVRVYRSSDLQTWIPAGAVGGMYAFDPFGSDYQTECNSAAFGCFEPHPARRPDGTWVMWVNAIRDPAGYIVLTADAPGGPYTRVATSPALALGPTRDGSGYGAEDITVDPNDPATAYLTYTMLGTHNHQIAVEQLDPTWTTGTGRVATLPEIHVEAPSMFKRGALWYLSYSDPACPYCNNAGSSYDTATNPFGPWTKRGTPWANSCVGQHTGISELAGQYVYESDRWVQKPTGGFQPNQYGANNYLAPVTFNADGTIPPQRCIPTWTF